VKKRILSIAMLAIFFGVAAVAIAGDEGKFEVKPAEFDPIHTHLVNAAWLTGIGCPTNAQLADANAQGQAVPGGTYTDGGCPIGDPKDKNVEGLLLAKTGPTANFAASFAEIKGLKKNTTLTELGWDIRKPFPAGNSDARGSHCGAGAPRWNVETTSEPTAGSGTFFFIGCNSPPPAQTGGPASGFTRDRWSGAGLVGFSTTSGLFVNLSGATIKSLAIVFDEGQDAAGGPDSFGLAVLDNIDINGTLVGRGPTDPN